MHTISGLLTNMRYRNQMEALEGSDGVDVRRRPVYHQQPRRHSSQRRKEKKKNVSQSIDRIPFPKQRRTSFHRLNFTVALPSEHVVLVVSFSWASAHSGKWGQLTPPEKMDEKLEMHAL